MFGLSLEELCKKCNVKCKKCLDTGKMWSQRGHWTAQFDGRGNYDKFRCNACSDGHWFDCSHTSNLYEGNIPIFHMNDNNEGSRRNILMPIYNKIQEKLELERLERLKKEKLEREKMAVTPSPVTGLTDYDKVLQL